MSAAATFLSLLSIWAMIGAGVAVLFLTIGIDRIDEDARGAYVFRVLLIPGILVIWPLVLWRWAVLETDRDLWHRRYAPPRKAHVKVAFGLILLILLILTTGLSIRQSWPDHIAPERLSHAEEPS
ncbi:MAG: hypothetical protein AB8B58_15175 [Roseobacter sp.]